MHTKFDFFLTLGDKAIFQASTKCCENDNKGNNSMIVQGRVMVLEPCTQYYCTALHIIVTNTHMSHFKSITHEMTRVMLGTKAENAAKMMIKGK